MADREPRDTQTREKQMKKKGWERPTLLPTPTPREGVMFRWIATAVMGQPMTPNVSSKLDSSISYGSPRVASYARYRFKVV